MNNKKSEYDNYRYYQNYQKDLEYVDKVTHDERERLLAIPGIVGTGLTTNKVTGLNDSRMLFDCNTNNNNDDLQDLQHQVVVYLDSKESKENKYVRENIPKYINDIRVVKNVSGRFIANSFTTKIRPLRAGSSIFRHGYKYAGTFAGFPIDMSPEGLNPDGSRRRVLLSCNHVLAMDWGPIRDAKKGDPIIQPPIIDHVPAGQGTINSLLYCNKENYSGYGGINNRTGSLDRWVRVESWIEGLPPSNIIDGAVEVLDPNIQISDTNMCGYVPNGWIDPIPGTFVKTAGPFSECGFGEHYIHSTNASVMMQLFSKQTTCPGSDCFKAKFVDQILISGTLRNPASVYGDSGSLVMHADTNSAIGMLIGGGFSSLLYHGTFGRQGELRKNWKVVYPMQIELPFGFGVVNKIEHLQNMLQVSYGTKQIAPIPQPSHRKCAINFDLPLCMLVRGSGQDECPASSDWKPIVKSVDSNYEYINQNAYSTIYPNTTHPCESNRVIVRIRILPLEPPDDYFGVYNRVVVTLENWRYHYNDALGGNIAQIIDDVSLDCFQLGDIIRLSFFSKPPLGSWMPDKWCENMVCHPPHEPIILTKNYYEIDCYFRKI